MSRFFLYRINSSYDGFLPCHIRGRAYRHCISYNWHAYVETLEPGDIVLTYFSGRGCRKGVYALAKILNIKLGARQGNVVGRLLGFSSDNYKPLIDAKVNSHLFQALHSRCRGAELVIPDHLEGIVCRLLIESGAITATCGPKGFPSPISTKSHSHSLRDVPPINVDHLSKCLRKKGVLAAYWIRPSQASWMCHAPEWLQRITRVFHKFKAGDPSRLDILALALAKRVVAEIKKGRKVGAILSVPLSEHKKRNGEMDRVGELAKRLSAILDVPYNRSLLLKGGVSRRFYKKHHISDIQFKKAYQRNLGIRRTRHLVNCIGSEREILLIDDVYTDGITTETIVDSLKRELGEGVRVKIATLGIMAKARNMNENTLAMWR